MIESAQPQNHGINVATLETDFQPGLECVCGFLAVGNDWEDVGSKFDEHLEDNGF